MKKSAYYLIALLAVLCVTCGYEKSNTVGTICDQRYALCTSAKCIPDPDNSKKAICFCEVYEGKSFGKDDCKKRSPFKDRHGIEHLLSNYSFAQYSSKKTLVCPSGNPWTFCLDKPCTVDPADPKKAICECEIRRSEAFVTLGGDCDKSTCKTAYWSGATVSDVNGAMGILTQALGLSKSPENYCPE